MSPTMPSSALKRIMCEVAELQLEAEKPDSFFKAEPMENDFFEWHFTVRGPPDTPFEGGVYHGRIILPPDYPYKAPEILILTPNGRFEVNTPICLSITSHHQETWQPSWGIRTIITALVGFMPSKDAGIGALQYSDDERRRLACKSPTYICQQCGSSSRDILAPQDRTASAPCIPSPSTTPSSPTNAAQPTPTQRSEEPFVAESHSQQFSQADTVQRGTSADDQAQVGVVAEELPPREPSPTESAADPPLTRDAAIPPSIQSSNSGQEKELLYFAYAIALVMFGVIVKKVTFVYLGEDPEL